MGGLSSSLLERPCWPAAPYPLGAKRLPCPSWDDPSGIVRARDDPVTHPESNIGGPSFLLELEGFQPFLAFQNRIPAVHPVGYIAGTQVQ